MVYGRRSSKVTDEERRDFLKALGVGSAVAVGGVSLNEVRDTISAASTETLAPIGQSIKTDVAGELDGQLLASSQATFAEQATAVPSVVQRGFPTDGPRDDFAGVAAAGQPIYDHLGEVGFFESTTENLPEFTPEYLTQSVKAFVGSEQLAAPLTDIDLTTQESTDLVATVISNAQALSDYHWVATDQIPRGEIEIGEEIPPMTKGATGGVLLWLEDLDTHLWQKRTLLTDEILEAAAWHAQSMAAGFHLMSKGAKAIADESGALSDAELGALLSTGFAIQAISQNLLPQDVYWITEEMRSSRRTDLKTITESQ
jgi:hypothetical protein